MEMTFAAKLGRIGLWFLSAVIMVANRNEDWAGQIEALAVQPY